MSERNWQGGQSRVCFCTYPHTHVRQGPNPDPNSTNRLCMRDGGWSICIYVRYRGESQMILGDSTWSLTGGELLFPSRESADWWQHCWNSVLAFLLLDLQGLQHSSWRNVWLRVRGQTLEDATAEACRQFIFTERQEDEKAVMQMSVILYDLCKYSSLK